MKLRNNRGMSLVEVVIAFAVVLICVSVLYKVAVRSYRQSANTREDFQASRLRSYLAAKSQCPTTRPAACDAPGTYLQLKDKSGAVLIGIPSPNSKIFGFEVHALCVDCIRCTNGKKILIQYTRKKRGDDPGTYWEDLHDGMPFHCVVPS